MNANTFKLSIQMQNTDHNHSGMQLSQTLMQSTAQSEQNRGRATECDIRESDGVTSGGGCSFNEVAVIVRSS
ncbi:hypothetical protein EYF80_009824 [Liparis tanakae]|uniref:Uncharacterized protein n=1 Tax=Liparis tanakae TaxID=230148 RepID=A0A4Z2IQ63_9TELE|nr:hypothetical protein EYF80_009824 [Liparis tanakae]